jgi:hypothetical protein
MWRLVLHPIGAGYLTSREREQSYLSGAVRDSLRELAQGLSPTMVSLSFTPGIGM